MNPEDLNSLYDAVARNTGDDPRFMGYLVRRFADSENKGWNDLAQELELSVENVVLLCLCRTPRPERFQEDLRVICARTGANQDVVARLIRQEQAIVRWQNKSPGTTAGWLLAASDSDESSETAGNQEVDSDEP